MNTETKHWIIVAAIAGVVGYLWWKGRQANSGFSNYTTCNPPKFYCAELGRCVNSTDRCDRAIQKRVDRENA